MSKATEAHEALKAKRKRQYHERKARNMAAAAGNEGNDKPALARLAGVRKELIAVSGNEMRIPFKSFRIEGREIIFTL